MLGMRQQNRVPRHRNTQTDGLYCQTVRQDARTLYLHPVGKHEQLDGCVDHDFLQRVEGGLQRSRLVEPTGGISLDMAEIAIKEID